MSTTCSTRTIREYARKPPTIHLDVILPNPQNSQASGQRGVSMVIYQCTKYGHVRTTCRLKRLPAILWPVLRGMSMNFNCNTTSHVDISLDVIPSHCNLHTKARTRQSLLGPSKANQIVQIFPLAAASFLLTDSSLSGLPSHRNRFLHTGQPSKPEENASAQCTTPSPT